MMFATFVLLADYLFGNVTLKRLVVLSPTGLAIPAMAQRRSMASGAIALATVAALASVHPVVFAHNNVRAVPVTVEVTNAPFTLAGTLDRTASEGQPVIVSLALSNGGTLSPVIDGSASEQASFDITVTDNAGRAVERTADGDRILTAPMSASMNDTIILAPKQTLDYHFNLARLFDLTRPGEYTVQIRRSLWPIYSRDEERKEVPLVLKPLKVRLVEDAAVVSSPTAFRPMPSSQPFLYMVSTDLTRPNNPVSRYRVAEDGSVSSAFDASILDSAAVAGRGATSVAATPNGDYLYISNCGDDTVSQFRIGNDGKLAPLSPPTVPSIQNPSCLVMDPKGRFVYAASGEGNALYTIGPDGGLTMLATTTTNRWAADRGHNLPPFEFGVMNALGTVLYTDGTAGAYRLAADGRVTALPTPPPGAAGPFGGPNLPIALSPSGQLAFVLESASTTTLDHRVVSMHIDADGTLTPVPQVQAPHLSVSGADTTLSVDPAGRFLIVDAGSLMCYRIGSDGSLTPCGEVLGAGVFSSVFFVPGNPLVYAVKENPGALRAFRLDDRTGLIPLDVDMPERIPYNAHIAFAVAPTPPDWKWPKDGLVMWVRLAGDALPSGKPVIATVTLKNVTSRPIPSVSARRARTWRRSGCP